MTNPNHFFHRSGGFTFRKSTLNVIADAPYRIEPKMPLPLLCFVQHSLTESVKLESVAVKITQEGKTVLSATPFQRPVIVENSFWQKTFSINLPENLTGKFSVDVYFRIEIDGKTRTVRNNSLKGLKNPPLEVFRADDPFPRFKDF